MDRQIERLRQLPPEKQKLIDALEKRSRDLNRQAWKRTSSGTSEADGLMAQSFQLAQLAREVRREHLQSVLPQIDQINRERATAAIQLAHCSRAQ